MVLRIIAEETDVVAEWLGNAAISQGIELMCLSHEEAATSLSVVVDDGKAIVRPDLPTFFRLPTNWGSGTDQDTRFHAEERIAAIWAGLALCQKPVVNRPNLHGLLGRWSKSAALIAVRTGIAAQPEVYTKQRLPNVNAVGRFSWWAEDLATFGVAEFPEHPAGDGPYCYRASDVDAGFELVIVVGRNGFATTLCDLSALTLEQRSIDLVAVLGLRFASVAWEISKDRTTAHLIYVDPNPRADHLAARRIEILAALIAELIS
jgi:hypothetical protein